MTLRDKLAKRMGKVSGKKKPAAKPSRKKKPARKKKPVAKKKAAPRKKKPAAKKKPAKKRPPRAKRPPKPKARTPNVPPADPITPETEARAQMVIQDGRMIHLFAKAYLASAYNGAKAAQTLFPDATVAQQIYLAKTIMERRPFQKLLAEEMALAAKDFDMNSNTCVSELVNHLDSNPLDYFNQCEKTGSISLRTDLKLMPRHVQRRVRSVKVTTTTMLDKEGNPSSERQVVELKTVDPQRALHGLCLRFKVFEGDQGGDDERRSIRDILENRLAAVGGDARKMMEEP